MSSHPSNSHFPPLPITTTNTQYSILLPRTKKHTCTNGYHPFTSSPTITNSTLMSSTCKKRQQKTETQESTHLQIPSSIHVFTSTSNSFPIPIPQHSPYHHLHLSPTGYLNHNPNILHKQLYFAEHVFTCLLAHHHLRLTPA